MTPERLLEGKIFLQELKAFIAQQGDVAASKVIVTEEELACLHRELLAAINDPQQEVPDPSRFNALRQLWPQQRDEVARWKQFAEKLVDVETVVAAVLAADVAVAPVAESTAGTLAAPATPAPVLDEGARLTILFEQAKAIVALPAFKDKGLLKTQPRQIALLAFLFYGRKPFLCEDFTPFAMKLVGRDTISAEIARAAIATRGKKSPLLFIRTDLSSGERVEVIRRGGSMYRYSLMEDAAHWAEATLAELQAELARSSQG